MYQYLKGFSNKLQQTSVQQYDFMFTVTFHSVLSPDDIHTTIEKHVHCVPQCQSRTGLTNYKHKNNLFYWKHQQQNFIKKLHSSDTKTGILFATCAYPWYPSLWQVTP